VAFFATSIALTILATKRTGSGSVFDSGTSQSQPAGGTTAPAEQGTGGSVLPQLPDAPKVPVTP
jgi:hypothetical protein